MRRACKVTLKFATAYKRKAIRALLQSYRGAVNFYIRSLWKEYGGLDKETLARLEATRLSQRFKSQTLKQALEVAISTKKAAKATGICCGLPVFRGAAVLDSKFVSVEEGRGSFDLVVRLSTLHQGHRIDIPTKATRVLFKWLAKPGAKLVQGCGLTENGIILWVDIPDAEVKPVEAGKILGVDVGVAKVLVDSDGQRYGTEFRAIRDKVLRRRPGSKGKRRARIERDQYLNRTIKQLPWGDLSVLGVEDLNGVKRGKKQGRGKNFRKAVAPWTYRRVLSRAECLAQENRVRLVAVPPAYTSRVCPRCGREHKENRRGEQFLCVYCGYKADSDHVGAQNVLARTLATIGSVESPVLKKAV